MVIWVPMYKKHNYKDGRYGFIWFPLYKLYSALIPLSVSTIQLYHVLPIPGLCTVYYLRSLVIFYIPFISSLNLRIM